MFKSGFDFGVFLNFKFSVGNLDLKSGVIFSGKFVEIRFMMLFIRCGVILMINNSIEEEGSVGGSGWSLGNGGFGGGYGGMGGVGYSGLIGGSLYGLLYELD